MQVLFRIEGDKHHFFPDSTMGNQFFSFLTAVYCLYNEGCGEHLSHYHQRKQVSDWGAEEWGYPRKLNNETYYKSVPTSFEGGGLVDLIVSRRSVTDNVMPAGVPDPVIIDIWYNRRKCRHYQYTVDGRDLCYALAKGYTEAIKKYGFHGYLRSSGEFHLGDDFRVDELLFVKAYALGAMEARETNETPPRPGRNAVSASPFEKEIELLLFDM